MLVTALKGYEISLLYIDRRWGGIIIISIVVLYIFTMLVSFLAVSYAIYYAKYIMGIHILPAGVVKLETSVYLLTSALVVYFVSSKVKKAAVIYCVKKEMITVK